MKKFLLLFLSVALVLFAVGTVSATSFTWTDNGHEYEFVSFSGLWEAAQADVLTRGAGWNLASITSTDELNFITSTVISPSPTTFAGYWLGGYQTGDSYDSSASYATNASDPNNALGWNYVDGETFVGGLWNSGQPDDYNEDQMHLMLFYDPRTPGWGLDDNTSYNPDGLMRGYIAERSAVPEPATMLLLGLGLIGLAGVSRKKFKK